MPDAIKPSPIDSEIEKLRSEISNDEATSASLSQRAEKLRSNLSELERLAGESTQKAGGYQSEEPNLRGRFDELQSFFNSSSKIIDSSLDAKQKGEADAKIKKIKADLDNRVKEKTTTAEKLSKAVEVLEKAKKDHDDSLKNYRQLQNQQAEISTALDEATNLKTQIEKEKSYPKKYFLNSELGNLLAQSKIPTADEYSNQLQQAWLAVRAAKDRLLSSEEERSQLEKEFSQDDSSVKASTESLRPDTLRVLEQPVTRNEKA